MSYTIEPIPAVMAYFGDGLIPTIVQTYRPDKGWQPYLFKKRVSRSWVRKLRELYGVTWVALEHPSRRGRPVDFRVEELLR
jgi:hypothetical protein